MTKGNGILIGMGFGVAIGAGIGFLTHNIGLWMSLGIAFGVLWLDYLLTKMTMMKASSLSDD